MIQYSCMKPLLKLPLVLLTTLSSCGQSRFRHGSFYSGYFYGEYEGQAFYLRVDNIPKGEYESADGKNVIKSKENNPPYYRCEFYYYVDDVRYTLDFYDAKYYPIDNSPIDYWQVGNSFKNTELMTNNYFSISIHVDSKGYQRVGNGKKYDVSNIDYESVINLEELYFYYIFSYWTESISTNDNNQHEHLTIMFHTRFYRFNDIEKCPNLDIPLRY